MSEIALTPEARKLKQTKQKEYNNRYWNKKASETQQVKADGNVSVTRGKMTDEAYIKALENSNKTLGSENRRLVSEIIKIKSFLSGTSLIFE